MVAKWLRALALLLRKEGWGILKSLVLEVFEDRLRHNVSYREVNSYNQSIKYNKHVLYKYIERKRK